MPMFLLTDVLLVTMEVSEPCKKITVSRQIAVQNQIYLSR